MCFATLFRPGCSVFQEYYKQIPGINNTKDVYDLMAYKYSTIFHRNPMSANNFSDNSTFTCLDIYGTPTRMFDGIQSCSIQYLYNSSKGDDYVFKYSGPLIYGNFEYIPNNFFNTTDTAVQYEVNKTDANTAVAVDIPPITDVIYNEQENESDSQYCYFHRNGKTFYSYTCVCHGEKQDNCKIPKDKRICAFDISKETELATAKMKDIWIEKQCEYYFISESEENVSISVPNFDLLSIFPAVAPCDNYQAEEWCSKNRKNFYETYKACCNETDFCNKMWVIKLKEIRGEMMRSPFKVSYLWF
uniref:Astacin domain-containing protein n=1 Tax=Panagrolaimus davidi TaxID=227884 RepID=A0A914QVT5_9BILA